MMTDPASLSTAAQPGPIGYIVAGTAWVSVAGKGAVGAGGIEAPLAAPVASPFAPSNATSFQTALAAQAQVPVTPVGKAALVQPGVMAADATAVATIAPAILPVVAVVGTERAAAISSIPNPPVPASPELAVSVDTPAIASPRVAAPTVALPPPPQTARAQPAPVASIQPLPLTLSPVAHGKLPDAGKNLPVGARTKSKTDDQASDSKARRADSGTPDDDKTAMPADAAVSAMAAPPTLSAGPSSLTVWTASTSQRSTLPTSIPPASRSAPGLAATPMRASASSMPKPAAAQTSIVPAIVDATALLFPENTPQSPPPPATGGIMTGPASPFAPATAAPASATAVAAAAQPLPVNAALQAPSPASAAVPLTATPLITLLQAQPGPGTGPSVTLRPVVIAAMAAPAPAAPAPALLAPRPRHPRM